MTVKSCQKALNQSIKSLAGLLSSRKMRLAFSFAYLILAILSFTCFTANRPFLGVCSLALTGWGAVILVSAVVSSNFKKFDVLGYLLMAFLLSFLISALSVVEYGVIENIKGFIWLTFELVLLYGLVGEETTSKDALLFVGAFSIIAFVYAAAGTVMAVVGFGYVDWVGDEVVTTIGGMHAGRLYGMYSDPTYGAICCLVALFFGWYLYLRLASRPSLCFALTNSAVQLLCLPLTGSRTALVAGIVALFAMMLIVAFKSDRFGNQTIFKKASAIRVLLVLLVPSLYLAWMAIGGIAYRCVEPSILLAFGGPVTSQEIIFEESFASRVPSQLEPSSEYVAHVELPSEDATYGKESPYDDLDAYTSAKEVEEGDYAHVASEAIDSEEESSGLMMRDPSAGDSGRLSLWASAVELWRDAPLFGVSHRNLFEYAQVNCPDLYLVSAGLTTMHNVFVDVLVSQGLVGLLLLLAFVAIASKVIICNLFGDGGKRSLETGLLFSALLSIAVSALFYSEILYINTIGSVVFWFILGYLVNQGKVSAT